MAPTAQRGAELPGALTVDGAMRRALDLASTGPAHGPNPQVGCVLLAPDSHGRTQAQGSDGAPGPLAGEVPDQLREVVAEGAHHGAGTPHAEADALTQARRAGRDVRGAVAVITLEPCCHAGRTPSCASALADAGVAEVIYAVADPNPRAAGGADLLRSRGVQVSLGPREVEARAALAPWLTAVTCGRPYVSVKIASSLDGKVAAADGTSRWITGIASREDTHARRAQVDAIAVGTGTALHDDPALTARVPGHGTLAEHQPLRVVVGHRDVPAQARLRGPGGELVHLRTQDVHNVLEQLNRREVRHLLVEGGPQLTSAFLSAGLVDEVHHYLAPVFLGTGTCAVGDLGLSTLTDATRWHTTTVRRLDQDVLIVARATTPPRPALITPQED